MTSASPLAGASRSPVLTDLERCLLRLGRVQVDADVASHGRDVLLSLAERGLMAALRDPAAATMIGEITYAGRCALAWAEGRPTARVS
jgi:hypothetical protein